MSTQAPITRLNNDILIYLSRFLTPRGTVALASTCQQFFPALMRQAYLNDIEGGRCDALWWACEFEMLPTVQRCLELGAPTNQYLRRTDPRAGYEDWRNWPRYQPQIGQTPLSIAISSMNPEIVRALLENGADSNMAYREFGVEISMPLELLMLEYKPEHSPSVYLDIMGALLDYGANPNLVVDPNFPAALQFSLVRHRTGPIIPVEATRMLLEHGAVAVRHNIQHPSAYLWLMHMFLWVNRVGPPNGTVVEKIDLILQYHAGALHPRAWEIPLYIILSNPRQDTRQLLEIALRHGCDPNALCDNIWRAHYDSPLKVMINVALHTRDAACFYRNTAHALAMVEMLLKAGADPDLRDQPRPRIVRDGEWAGQCTALVFLAWHVKTARHDRDLCGAIMLLLLQHGASPDIPLAASGLTALHLACGPSGPNRQHAEWLLAHGADVNARDADGKTALQLLCDDDGWPTPAAVGVIDLLVRHGAVTDGRDFGSLAAGSSGGEAGEGGKREKIMRSYAKTSDYCRWKTRSVLLRVKGVVREIREEH
ncbi:hypothetical protein SLS62_010446 [Diatrype stigma]|uniref:Uncharacterized protein n=1 Tax=Diatrype stigma TaxID=117547 RepID=A0AAN9U8T7_9PEZI